MLAALVQADLTQDVRSMLETCVMLLDDAYVASVRVLLLRCERCGAPMLAVFDSMLDSDCVAHGYLGCQAAAGRYRYSPVMNHLRRAQNPEVAQFLEQNSLDVKSLALNSHTAVHVERDHPLDSNIRCMKGVHFYLCNSCFRKTCRRILVEGTMEGDLDPQTGLPVVRKYALSAVEQRHGSAQPGDLPELNSLAETAGIKVLRTFGYGSIKNY